MHFSTTQVTNCPTGMSDQECADYMKENIKSMEWQPEDFCPEGMTSELCSNWLKSKVSKRKRRSQKFSQESLCDSNLSAQQCANWLKENIKATDWNPADYCPADLDQELCSAWLKAKVSRKHQKTQRLQNIQICVTGSTDEQCANYLKEHIKLQADWQPSNFCPDDFSESMCSQWLKAKVSRRLRLMKKQDINCPDDLNVQQCSNYLKENIKTTGLGPSDFCPDDLDADLCSEFLKAKISRRTNKTRDCPTGLSDVECGNYLKENIKEQDYLPSQFCPTEFSESQCSNWLKAKISRKSQFHAYDFCKKGMTTSECKDFIQERASSSRLQKGLEENLCSDQLSQKLCNFIGGTQNKIKKRFANQNECPENLNQQQCANWLKENIKNTSWVPQDFCASDLDENQCSAWLKAKVSRKIKFNVTDFCLKDMSVQTCKQYLKQKYTRLSKKQDEEGGDDDEEGEDEGGEQKDEPENQEQPQEENQDQPQEENQDQPQEENQDEQENIEDVETDDDLECCPDIFDDDLCKTLGQKRCKKPKQLLRLNYEKQRNHF